MARIQIRKVGPKRWEATRPAYGFATGDKVTRAPLATGRDPLAPRPGCGHTRPDHAHLRGPGRWHRDRAALVPGGARAGNALTCTRSPSPTGG